MLSPPPLRMVAKPQRPSAKPKCVPSHRLRKKMRCSKPQLPAPKAARKEARWRKCPLCGQSVERKDLRLHYKTCCSLVTVPSTTPNVKGLLGTCCDASGNRVQIDFMAGALDESVGRELQRFAEKVVKQHSDLGLCRSLRRNHEGTLYGLGWSRRTRGTFGPPEVQALLADAEAMLIAALHPETYFAKLLAGLTTYQDSRIPDGGPIGSDDGPCCFVGVNYCARTRRSQQQQLEHGVPPATPLWGADLVRAKRRRANKALRHELECTVACEACKRSCAECPHCPIHQDKDNTSATLALLWQCSKTPADHAARWLVGTHSYQVKNGLICLFNGKASPHGLWIPPKLDRERWPIYACVFVNR